MVSYPNDSMPRIQWTREDGTLLICRDGTQHWLTRAEILWLRLGFTTIEQLDAKHNREPNWKGDHDQPRNDEN